MPNFWKKYEKKEFFYQNNKKIRKQFIDTNGYIKKVPPLRGVTLPNVNFRISELFKEKTLIFY